MPDLAQHVRYYQWFIVTELGITASALTLACALATHAFIPHHHTGTEPLLAATPGTNHRDTEPGAGPPALGIPLPSKRGQTASRAAGLPPVCLILAMMQPHSGVRVQDFITHPLSPTLSAPSPGGAAHPQHQQHPTPAALRAVQTWAQILAFIFTTEPGKMPCAPLSPGTSSLHHLPGLLPSPVRKRSPHVHPPLPSPLALPRGRIPPGSDKSLTLITAIN